jgi:CheY-like chemotaxis protein
LPCPEGITETTRRRRFVNQVHPPGIRLAKNASGDGPTRGQRSFREAILRDVNVERVLLVEAPNGRDMLKIGLEAAGFEVAVADDAETALTRASTLAPAVVIIEITLPTMDGWELARRLRQLFGPRIRLIALTSRGDPEDHVRSLEAGFNVHLVKPVPPSTIQQTIRNLLAA